VQLEGIPAECVVRFGDPVEEILAEAESWGANLLVVTNGDHRSRHHLRLGGPDCLLVLSGEALAFRKSRIGT
jgi:nucleotide-binding universal stress UspA family protein